ncbi:MAG: hypothetical protein HS130_08425 [Deltaproteobacteria bacterium]|nr:hypothetical protein [Deltaproteobacteria bacterium]
MDHADQHGIDGELERLRRRVREYEKKEAERRRNLEENPAAIEALMEYIPEGIIIVSAPDETIRMASRRRYACRGTARRASRGSS